ncbi:hypothetical protein FRACYDRAFT_251856 [Fragilariopsis cylindrus CCMP1102]|uniref:Uncharacterized protein n=1 Tax=Fragilariopsis cylindrus CCMP1102 TaxID=635003 RepID=A0A1E7ENG4_9STRA|nr:hypothetical protein FRACYDRAFT_251856 [Fragilariopsis cylindrus CCMP1102]|eukprot:OEU07113.1 hypothetical protein FRACYDRAFT_251856 [Fragilariopsis cylindrus CCMP1102]
MKLLQYSVLFVLGSTLLFSNGAAAALRGAASDAEDEDVAVASYAPGLSVILPGLSNAAMTAMTLNLSQESGRGPPGVYAWCTKLQPLSTTLPDVMVTSWQKVTVQRERPIANMWLCRWASANSRQPVFRKIRDDWYVHCVGLFVDKDYYYMSMPLTSTSMTRQQIRKQNQLHQNQNKYTYFIYGQNGEQQSNWIYNAQFLHVGKAGGGTIRERIEKLNFNIEYKHSPLGRNYTQTTTTTMIASAAATTASTPAAAENEKMTMTTPTTYLIGVRDPIDRYISNFYWQGLTLCLEENDTDNSNNDTTTTTTTMSYYYNDTRKNGEPLSTVTRKPNKFCRLQTKNIPTSIDISNMIHIKYNSNASELAESLCSTTDDAIQDMNMLSHAKHTLWDWLQVTGILVNQHDDTTSNSSSNPTKINKNVNVAGMVVENGYDFLQQIDDSIEYAFTNSFNLQQQNSDNTNNDQQHQSRSQRQLVGDHHHTNTTNTTAHDIMEMKLFDLNNNHDGDGNSTKSNNDSKNNGNGNQRKKVKEHSSSSSKKEVLLDYSELPWIQKMQHHQQNGLSKKGACCLANHFYWKDYHILFKPTSFSANDVITSTFLSDLVCNYGTRSTTSTSNNNRSATNKSQLCIDALNSISQRYKNLQCNNDNEEENIEEEEEQQYTDSDNDNDNDNEENNDADVDVTIKINIKDKEHQRRHEVVDKNKNDLTTATIAIVSASTSSSLSTKATSSPSTSAETCSSRCT